jgi:hypothetical protein
MNTVYTAFIYLVRYSEQATIISLKNINILLCDADIVCCVGGSNWMFAYYFDGFRASKSHLIVCNLLKLSKNSGWLTFT